MRYLIIGNSVAAIACIEAIRNRDKTGKICVLSDENVHCYGRPTISYCLAGVITEEQMKYRPDDFYEKNGVELYLGVKAERIDAQRKEVFASDGKQYGYDQLLVATGSRPFIPTADGLDKVKFHTFMSYHDMKMLETELSAEKDVVIIGAGLIGLKCAEGILKSVKSVTVIDLADRALASVTDKESSDFVKAHLENKGVKFILSDCAESYTQNSVRLRHSKKVVNFDLLIMAAGVSPNVSLVSEAGGRVNRGILINEKMQTSLPSIYSAGDCTEGFDSSSESNRVLALLPNACMQGKTAGTNMSGGNAEYLNAITLNAVGFFGLHMLSAGIYEGECLCVRGKNSLKKLFVKDGRLVGFILINDIQRAGIYTSLVREKTPLDSVDFEMLVNAPALLAFSSGVRAAKLSRRV